MLGPRALEPLAARAGEVRKTYGSQEARVVALRGVSADFARGRFTAIMGPTGSGKSTLMHCLAGLDTVTRGTVQVGGTRISGLADRAPTRMRRDRIGFIFQQFNLLPTLTAAETLRLPMDIAGRWWVRPVRPRSAAACTRPARSP
jgi:putative ABC transport system ATP-binding protein